MKRVRLPLQESGFSLVSTLVAAGILSIIALFSMQIVNNTLDGAKAVERTLAATTVSQEVLSALKDETACINSMGANFNPLGLRNETTRRINQVVNHNGTVVARSDGAALIEGRRVILNRMELRDYVNESSTEGIATLRLRFQRPPRAGLGPSELHRDIRIKLFRHNSGANINLVHRCAALAGADEELWLMTGTSDIYYRNLTGRVGIGTANPQSTLHVQGTLTLGSVTRGQTCAPVGAQAFDATTGVPVFCRAGSPAIWAATNPLQFFTFKFEQGPARFSGHHEFCYMHVRVNMNGQECFQTNVIHQRSHNNSNITWYNCEREVDNYVLQQAQSATPFGCPMFSNGIVLSLSRSSIYGESRGAFVTSF